MKKNIIFSIIGGIIATFVSLIHESVGKSPTIISELPQWGWPLAFIRDHVNSESISGQITFYDTPLIGNFLINVLFYSAILFIIGLIILLIVKKNDHSNL